MLFDEAERPRAIGIWGAANFIGLQMSRARHCSDAAYTGTRTNEALSDRREPARCAALRTALWTGPDAGSSGPSNRSWHDESEPYRVADHTGGTRGCHRVCGVMDALG